MRIYIYLNFKSNRDKRVKIKKDHESTFMSGK